MTFSKYVYDTGTFMKEAIRGETPFPKVWQKKNIKQHLREHVYSQYQTK